MKPGPRVACVKTPTIKDIRATAEARRRKHRRRRRLAGGGGIAVVAWVALVFFGLPPLVRSRLETRLSEASHRRVTVERVRLNPLALSATVEGLAANDLDGSPLVAWQRLYVNFDAWSLVVGEWRFQAIELNGFSGHLRRAENGSLNVADLWPEANASERGVSVWARQIVVDHLVIDGARLNFTDVSGGRLFAKEIGPLTFTVEGFHTTRDETSPYLFEASTAAGERLAWRGTLSFAQGRSSGEFKLNGISLPQYMSYAPHHFRGEVQAGTLDVAGHYELDWAGAAPALRWTEGRVRLAGLALADPGEATPKVQLRELELNAVTADLMRRHLQIGEVKVSGGRIEAVNTANGIDLLDWWPRSATAASLAADREAALMSPSVRVDKLAIDGLALRWTDATLPQSRKTGVDALSLAAGTFSSAASDDAVPVAVCGRLTTGGTLSAEGTVNMGRGALDMAVALDGVALAPWGAYLAGVVDGRIQRGVVAADGRVAGVWPALSFSGTTSVTDFAVGPPGAETTLASWTALRFDGLKLELRPLAVKVATVTWSDPQLRLAVAADGAQNWGVLLPRGAADTSGVTGPAAEKIHVAVEEVVWRNAAVSFTDGTINPAARLSLSEGRGTLRGFSSENPTKGELDLEAKVNGNGALTLQGRFNPVGQPAFMDVAVDLERMDLRPLRAYFAKYAGYQLEGGSMSWASHVGLNDRVLDSDTLVTMEGFNLGARAPGPDATALPVPLAVALLKDRAGQIVIDLPVEGELDDPNFRIGRVVGRVLVNVLTKAATAPFALLGALVGEGTDDLALQAFTAGSSALDAEAQSNLQTLAEALAARPQLGLDITGAYEPSADAAALRQQELDTRVRRAAWQAQAGRSGAPIPMPEAFQASETERSAAIGRLFAEAFPEEITAMAMATAGTPRAAASAPVSPAPPIDNETLVGWLRSVFAGRSGATEPPPVAAPALVTTVPALPVATMEARLLATIEVTEEALRELANARAIAVQERLGALDSSLTARVSLRPIKAGASQVELGLR